MLDQIRDLGRSLFYPRHTESRATAKTPFEKGVFAARMGMEKDDNPYSSTSHAFSDWEAGYESAAEADEACDLD